MKNHRVVTRAAKKPWSPVGEHPIDVILPDVHLLKNMVQNCEVLTHPNSDWLPGFLGFIRCVSKNLLLLLLDGTFQMEVNRHIHHQNWHTI